MVVKGDIGHASGKVTSVITHADTHCKFEISWHGSGTVTDIEVKDCGRVTFEYLESGNMRMTGGTNVVADGGTASFKGFAIAKNEGLTFPAGNYAGCGQIIEVKGSFKDLKDIIWLVYFEVDEQETTSGKLWSGPIPKKRNPQGVTTTRLMTSEFSECIPYCIHIY